MTDIAKAASPIRAACYIRMSTENQRYSPANQAAAIDEYAQRKGFTVVRTYIDKGKSGLTIKGRIGLQTLIADVQCAQTDFEVLLVYDISRWGRFQDADESAYYEFICRRSGVAVIYCAEQFDNDGSPAAVLIKSFKRAMAGEYSRELSTKTFNGQCRLSALGFRQGGVPGVGLRRLMVDDAGTPKVVMNSGEHKNLQTDRVVLALGPPEEVAVVRRIYSLFLEGRRIRAIAKLLNSEQPTMNAGGPWTTCIVRTVLSNEKYLGHNVFNRTSRKLKAAHLVQNAEWQWIRADYAFPAVIDEEQFERARLRLIGLCPRPTNKKMLEDLARLHRRLGKVNKRIIDAERGGMVQADTYRKRFGSLDRACELAGIEENPTSKVMLEDLVRLHEQDGRVTWYLINATRTVASVAAYRARFGSLQKAYELAGLRTRGRTDQKMIDDLIRLHRRVGRVSEDLISAEPGIASGQTYRVRFGSMAAAYKLAGLGTAE